MWAMCALGGDDDEEEPWPYVVNGWSDAIRCMNSVGRPFLPFNKMAALAEVFSSIDTEATARQLPSLTADTLIPVLLFVVCRTKLRFKHATLNYVQSFVAANRNIDKCAGRDLYCLANLDMVLRLMAKFPNFF